MDEKGRAKAALVDLTWKIKNNPGITPDGMVFFTRKIVRKWKFSSLDALLLALKRHDLLKGVK